jgi:hypothetical protein
MVGQYLPNNNENATVPSLQKKIASKPGLSWMDGASYFSVWLDG